MRVRFEEYMGKICLATAERSTCEKIHVGAVLTLDNYIISTGMNGAPVGLQHCTSEGCVLDAYNKCQRCVHAETNCLIRAHTTHNTELWVTHIPCLACTYAIINAGVKSVWYIENYEDPKAQLFPDYHGSALNYQLRVLNTAGIWTHQIRIGEK